MSVSEKVNTMEYIWNALTAHYTESTPAWHADVLAERRRKVESMVSGSALEKSVTHEIHYAALVRLRDIIRESFVAEVHPDSLILAP